MSDQCPEAELQAIVVAMGSESDQLDRVESLLLTYPDDARLRFLRGSILIGAGRLIEAHRELTQAVSLAPDFAIARFQLGFFQLTSGEAENALETWGRLDRLPDGHYLRKFIDGLRCLIRDDFVGAIANLKDGISLNQENPPLNKDMQLLIDECTPLAQQPSARQNIDIDVSEASLILGRFTGQGKPH
jgi:tetratricopeptide (TPR) repeat protein